MKKIDDTKLMKWIRVEDRSVLTPGGEPIYKCSKCGYEGVYGIENGPKPDRCPNCGREAENE